MICLCLAHIMALSKVKVIEVNTDVELIEANKLNDLEISALISINLAAPEEK